MTMRRYLVIMWDIYLYIFMDIFVPDIYFFGLLLQEG